MDEMGEWIEWHGGMQPVGDSTNVETELRDGSVDRDPAAYWDWRHSSIDPDSDIVRYRVVT